MKKSIKGLLVILGIMIAASTFAQDFSGQVRKEMSKCSFLAGEWQGEAWVIGADGKRSTSSVSESISFDLDSTVIALRGVGMSGGVKVHDALGVLYYDPFQQAYKMNSWLSKGLNTAASVELLGEGKLKWWFGAGPSRTIRYTITIQGDQWNEIGEMSTDGENWFQILEMNLVKN